MYSQKEVPAVLCQRTALCCCHTETNPVHPKYHSVQRESKRRCMDTAASTVLPVLQSKWRPQPECALHAQAAVHDSGCLVECYCANAIHALERPWPTCQASLRPSTACALCCDVSARKKSRRRAASCADNKSVTVCGSLHSQLGSCNAYNY